ncbi:splicing factor, arginine/serine-rich 15 [Ditylenchus destructor]|nr:splicing factor, arginine/serine-rich 15 [Ditylenchus destructor]
MVRTDVVINHVAIMTKAREKETDPGVESVIEMCAEDVMITVRQKVIKGATDPIIVQAAPGTSVIDAVVADDHVLIGSRTLWFGRIPPNCSEHDIRESVKDAGQPEKVIVVAPRGCAYVTMRERRAAFKIVDRLGKDLQVAKKPVKISWATIQGIKENEKLMDYWDSSRGIAQIPFSKLPERLDSLLEGAFLDIHTLPTHLKGLYDARGPIVPGQSQAPIAFPGMIPGMNVPNISVGSTLPQQIPPTANIFPFQQQLNLPPPIQFGVQANATDQQKQQQTLLPTMLGNLAAFGFPPGLLPPGGMDARFPPPFMNTFLPNTFSATSAATAPQRAPLIPSPNSIAQSFQSQNVTNQPRPTTPFGSENSNRSGEFRGSSDNRGRGDNRYRGDNSSRGNPRGQFRGFGFRGRGDSGRGDSGRGGGNFHRGGFEHNSRGTGSDDSFTNGGFGHGNHDQESSSRGGFRNDEAFRGSHFSNPRGGRFANRDSGFVGGRSRGYRGDVNPFNNTNTDQFANAPPLDNPTSQFTPTSESGGRRRVSRFSNNDEEPKTERRHESRSPLVGDTMRETTPPPGISPPSAEIDRQGNQELLRPQFERGPGTLSSENPCEEMDRHGETDEWVSTTQPHESSPKVRAHISMQPEQENNSFEAPEVSSTTFHDDTTPNQQQRETAIFSDNECHSKAPVQQTDGQELITSATEPTAMEQ